MEADAATEVKIEDVLGKIEREYGIEIVHAVESGSRVWGFASPDSDWDVRFIYKRPLSWYLSVQERRDVIEIPHKYDPLDISGWDIKKSLGLMGVSNPPLFEWLNSPVVYRTTPTVDRIRKLVPKYFNPRAAIYHYLHMADGNYRQYLRGDTVRLKKYLYVIRPLLCCEFISETHQAPPVVFDVLLDCAAETATWDNVPVNEIRELVARKKETAELGEGPRIEAINEWIERRLKHFEVRARTTAKHSTAADDLNELLFEIVTA